MSKPEELLSIYKSSCVDCDKKGDYCDKCMVTTQISALELLVSKKIITNADKIRSMTDEELAFLVFNINDVCGKASMHQHKRILSDLIEDYDLNNIKEWLQQEV